MRCAYIQARQLAFFLFGINVQCNACDGIFIYLKNKIVAQAFFDHRPRALYQFIRFDRGLGQRLNRADVFLLCGPDLLILVRVNQRADAVVGENLGQQTLVPRGR